MSGLVRVVTGAVVLLVMGLVGHPELALADDAAPPITILEYVPPTVPTWQTFVFRAAVDPVPIDHFECRLDAMPFETCISPWAPVLTAGQHTIAVRAVDVNGLADPTPEEATFAVRDKGPEVTVSINDGAAATGRYLVRLAITGPELWAGTRVHVANNEDVDGDGMLATAWIGQLQSLINADMGWQLDREDAGGSATPGEHLVCVQAEDVFGDLGDVTCDTITVDPSIATTVRIRVAASENPVPLGDRGIVRAVAEATDGVPIRDGTLHLFVSGAPAALSALAPGQLAETGAWVDVSQFGPGTYHADAWFDGSAELGDADAATTFTISSKPGVRPPQAYFEAPVPLPPWDAPAPFTMLLRSENNATASYQCRVDGASWSACVGQLDVPVLANGSHTAEVRGIGPTGVVQPVPDLVSWRVGSAGFGQWWVSTAISRLPTVSLTFDPEVGAQAVRISNSRGLDAQGRLSEAMEIRPAPALGAPIDWSLVDPTYGGADTDGLKTIWYQGQWEDGTWSAPQIAVVLLDRMAPHLDLLIESGTPFVDASDLLVLAKTDESATILVSDDPADLVDVDWRGTGTSQDLAFIAWPDDVPPGTVGTRTLYAKALDKAGNLSDIVSARIVIDRTAPVTQLRPIGFVVGSRVSASSVRAWIRAAASDTGSGVAHTKVQELTSTSTRTIASTTSSSVKVKRSLSLHASLRYRSRATDRINHVGAWATGPSVRPVLRDSGSSRIRWSGSWRTVHTSSALGGSYRRTASKGATATFRFTGQAIAVVGPRRRTGGTRCLR